MSDAAVTRPMKILLVENHEDTLYWLTRYLEDLGHAVMAARTLAEARAALASSAYDVLVSDIGLPDGMGWELLESAAPAHRPFAIAMSGFGMNADNSRSRAAGFSHHLVKPFKLAELDKLLETADRQGAP